MRILKTVQFYFPFQDRGGPIVKVRSLARGLVNRGNRVTVLTADLGFDKNNKFDIKIERCPWGWESHQEGIEAIYLSTLFHYRALTVNPGVAGYCSASLREFDVVHFYGLYDLLGPTVSYFCRRQGIPYVIEPMGMYRPIDRSFRLKRLWHRTLGSSFWRNATQIISTSELEYRELLNAGVPAAKLVLRYNGVDPISHSSQPPPGTFRAKWNMRRDEPLILFISRLIPRKGADMLIKAFAQVCPENGRLVIAGPEGVSGYRAYLEKCAEVSGIGARVIFTGPLYDDEKKSVFVDADLFVLPSRYENFANAAAEAVEYGIPVIVTDSCGICSLINDQAGLVIDREIETLADALRKLIFDKNLYARLKEGCRKVAAQLSWDHLTLEMEAHYSAALAIGESRKTA